jgi:hypothetical protein
LETGDSRKASPDTLYLREERFGRSRKLIFTMSRILRSGSLLIFLGLASLAWGQPPTPSAALAARRLAFAGYIGGNVAESVQAVAMDKDGGVWIAGSSASQFDFPGPNNPYQSTIKGATDIFLGKLKLNADGTSQVLFWTWIGGTGDEDVRAMALDSLGRVYLCGSTNSTDFPMGGYAFQTANAGATDAYILIVDPRIDGQDSLVFSSYYGGTQNDVATALSVEASGAVVVAGYTTSQDLPSTTGNVQPISRGGWDAFVFRVNPSLPSPVTYATYYGGLLTDVATGVAVDKNNPGIVWLTGYTASSDFPVTGDAYSGALGGPTEGFLVKLNLNKTGLDQNIYSTYFGGDGLDVPEKMILDTDGTIWVAGYTLSTNYPVTATAAQNYLSGVADTFITRFDPSKPASGLIAYSTYFGGVDGDVLHGFALMGGGKFAICGYTMSNDFPVTPDAIQSKPASAFADAFVSILDSTQKGSAARVFSTYYGGTWEDVANDLAVDAAGSVYVVGYAKSSDLTVTDGSSKQNDPPGATGFVMQISQ